MGVVFETSLGVSLLVTVLLGGGAAYLTGRAVALTWRPLGLLVVYVVLLSLAVRFIHYALFGGTFLDPLPTAFHYWLVDIVVLFVFAGLGFQRTRAIQMVGQYGWLYSSAGLLSWRRKNS